MKKDIATFTLDYGKCPPWLFERMVKLGREITYVLVDEFGPSEFVKRIADPVWFQALGTVLAFDWNASGLTTILTASLKESIRGHEKELGIFICGGKGATSKKTPDQITEWGSRLNFSEEQTNQLVYNSKLSAKVDSSLVQDGYQLYHHAFFFSRDGSWTVVQQGMNVQTSSARRYHWHDKIIQNSESRVQNEKINYVNQPHSAISSQALTKHMLNMVDRRSGQNRSLSTELVDQNYESLMKDIRILRKYSTPVSKTITLSDGSNQLSLLELEDTEFNTHPVVDEDFSKSKYLEKVLSRLTEEKPKDYESLLATKGVGPKTIRALSLVSEVIYGAKPSYEDPARYSFAHGGKDATPYPVDTKTYDQTITILGKAVRRSRLSSVEKDTMLKKILAF